MIMRNLESLKIDEEYYKNKYNQKTRKKVLLNVTDLLFGSASTISSFDQSRCRYYYFK